MVATLFHAADGEPQPGVIVLGGSEGGLADRHAALLASKGFTTLSVAYFGVDGLPAHLHRVPIEGVRAAAAWLRERPQVAGDKVGVVGASKGGELSLLLAS